MLAAVSAQWGEASICAHWPSTGAGSSSRSAQSRSIWTNWAGSTTARGASVRAGSWLLWLLWSASVTNAILNCHVCRKRRAVIDVRGLPARTVSAADIMMISADHNCPLNGTGSNGCVEPESKGGATPLVGVENSGLRSYHHLVLACLADPLDVVPM